MDHFGDGRRHGAEDAMQRCLLGTLHRFLYIATSQILDEMAARIRTSSAKPPEHWRRRAWQH